MRKFRLRFLRHLDLQAKIVLVLLSIIVPTFLIVTLAQNQLTRPILEDEIRQIGENSGKRLAAEIVSDRLFFLPKPTTEIENRVQQLLYSQPNIVRIDVIAKDAASGVGKLIASNVEEDPTDPEGPPAHYEVVDQPQTDYKVDESGAAYWEINVPVDQQKSHDSKSPRKVIGSVHVVISNKIVTRIAQTVWKMTAAAAGFSMIALLFGLGYFLKKTIQNDRRLREAENQNLQLTEQLHEAERQLMNTEKLAVMGQLTASFAHEIGTPLTAIGGHLQLIRDDLPEFPGSESAVERVDIINGQLMKIEGIVKSFLQSTSKPTSQRQLVDLNQLSDKTLRILKPRMESLGADIRRNYDRSMGPLRVVPLDMEQILINLLNNSLDSMSSKKNLGKAVIEVSSESANEEGKSWAKLSIYDTGEGINKNDLKNVLKPFFTTKPPGEGTGLGLPICQQLAHKYGGHLEIESREGAWTRVTVKIPYDTAV
jgi:signal transduction histidine kinase